MLKALVRARGRIVDGLDFQRTFAAIEDVVSVLKLPTAGNRHDGHLCGRGDRREVRVVKGLRRSRLHGEIRGGVPVIDRDHLAGWDKRISRFGGRYRVSAVGQTRKAEVAGSIRRYRRSRSAAESEQRPAA